MPFQDFIVEPPFGPKEKKFFHFGFGWTFVLDHLPGFIHGMNKQKKEVERVGGFPKSIGYRWPWVFSRAFYQTNRQRKPRLDKIKDLLNIVQNVYGGFCPKLLLVVRLELVCQVTFDFISFNVLGMITTNLQFKRYVSGKNIARGFLAKYPGKSPPAVRTDQPGPTLPPALVTIPLVVNVPDCVPRA